MADKETTTESTESALEAAEQSAEAEARAEQETAEQEEAAKIDEFLRSRGVPGRGGAYDSAGADDSDDDDGVTDPNQLAEEAEDEGGEEESEQQTQPTEEELMGRELEVITKALDQVEGKSEKSDQGEEQLSDAEIGFRRREESRRLQAVQGENEQLRNYMNALLSHMQQTGQQTAQPQQEGADETPEPDLFEDPNAYIDHALKERLSPLEEQRQEIDQLKARLQAQEVQQHVRKAETEWEQAHPGYLDRITAYRRAFVAELQHFGMPLEKAQVGLFENEKGLLRAALQLGINPAELLDRTAHRWIGSATNGNGVQQHHQGQQQQVQQDQKPPATKKAGKFDRARQAANSAAAGTLSEGAGGADGGEIDVDTLLASGASPDQIHTVLSKPGGRQNFFQLMNQLERAADAPDE